MGTRSLTIVKDEKKDLITIYRQMDGYPTGHGKELKQFLDSRVLCNGIGSPRTDGLIWANGMNCLAAQLVANLKTYKGEITVGSIYIYPNGTKAENCDADYLYIISEDSNKFQLKVYHHKKLIYNGSVSQFNPEEVEAEEND